MLFPFQVAVEISAQVEAFKNLFDGELPLYVDGHQHVHVLPGNYSCLLHFVACLLYHVA